MWTTRATWYPALGISSRNSFYTFDRTAIAAKEELYIYRHGYSGEDSRLQESYDVNGNPQLPVMPNTWYGNTNTRFEFEYVVARPIGIQKIFNGLKLISNRAKPDSIVIEIIGDGYDFASQKYPHYRSPNSKDVENVANWHLNDLEGLTEDKDINKVIEEAPINQRYTESPVGADNYADFTRPASDTIEFQSDTELLYDYRTKEQRLRIHQKVKDMQDEEYGRLMGNAYYKEDLWDIQIDPIDYKENTREKQTTVRDKYAKIRVCYTGCDLAVISAIKTLFTISYA
jgi:hypothetical protein